MGLEARLACPPKMWAGPPWLGPQLSPGPRVWVRVRATHVHLWVHSQQLGHPFKGSLVFFLSETSPPAVFLGRDLSYFSEDRRRQRGPSCVSRSCHNLAVWMGTDVCLLCEPCQIAKEGSGPGQGTRTPASTVCSGLLPRWVLPARIHTRGMSRADPRIPSSPGP